MILPMHPRHLFLSVTNNKLKNINRDTLEKLWKELEKCITYIIKLISQNRFHI